MERIRGLTFKDGVLTITVPLSAVAATATHTVPVEGEPEKKRSKWPPESSGALTRTTLFQHARARGPRPAPAMSGHPDRAIAWRPVTMAA